MVVVTRLWSVLIGLALALSPLRSNGAGPVIVPINKIDKSLVDKYVTIRGKIVETSNFSVGFKYGVADDTGKMAVTYFERTYDQLPKPELLRVGAVVQITGRVNEFQGDYELVPNRARETLVLTPTVQLNQIVRVTRTPSETVANVQSVPYATKRDIGSLNNGDHGAMVQVEGVVFSVEPFETGNDIVISDKTGAQKVRLWNVVNKRVGKDVFVKGTKINVIGKVRASRSRGLRIEPALPFDVVVVR
jgi:DNA/RNA endonuclease YhcR with UshA esterase domain